MADDAQLVSLRRTALGAPQAEAVGAVGNPLGLTASLCGLRVSCLVQRQGAFDRALFVVAPTNDRIRLT
jgi:hypothetical protein